MGGGIWGSKLDQIGQEGRLVCKKWMSHIRYSGILATSKKPKKTSDIIYGHSQSFLLFANVAHSWVSR